MILHVNDMKVVLPDDSTISALLKQLDRPDSGIAVAVNEEVIARADWETTVLKEVDRIMIIQATQGG